MDPLRTNTLEVLHLLADTDAQRRYEASVPIANVPAELVSQWFDDTYLPNSPRYRAAFNERELALLQEFSTFYEARLPKVPETLAGMQRSQVWQEIVAAAARTLTSLKGHGENVEYGDS